MSEPPVVPADAFALVYDPNEPKAGIQIWVPGDLDGDAQVPEWASLLVAFGMRCREAHEEAFRQEMFNWLDRHVERCSREKPDAATAAFLDDVPHEQFDEPEDR